MRTRGRSFEYLGLTAEDRDELVVDDLDDLLCGVQGHGDLGGAGPLLD